jgi:hypothetical protein
MANRKVVIRAEWIKFWIAGGLPANRTSLEDWDNVRIGDHPGGTPKNRKSRDWKRALASRSLFENCFRFAD